MERLQATSARLALYIIIVLPYGISGCKCDENAIPGDQLWRDLIMSASSDPPGDNPSHNPSQV